jgi:hypothetical protein
VAVEDMSASASPETDGGAGDASAGGSAELVDSATEGAAGVREREAAEERFGAAGAFALM